MALDQATVTAALENCDNDPIHTPGSIQGFGYLLATDAGFKKINYASDNISALFATGIERLLNSGPSGLFSRQEQHRIRNVLGHSTIEHQRERLFSKLLYKQRIRPSARWICP